MCISGFLPPLGERAPPSWRDKWNPFKHKPLVPPIDPPSGNKGQGTRRGWWNKKGQQPKKKGSANTAAVRKAPKMTIQETATEAGGTFEYSNGQKIDFLANRKATSSTVEYTDIAFYPQKATGNQMKNVFGRGEMLETINVLKAYAKSQGVAKLRIQWIRAQKSSSANPGHSFDKTFDL